jgi:hypothetical protein
MTRSGQRVGSAAVDLDQLETPHSPLKAIAFLGSRASGFVITLNRDWSGRSLVTGEGHYNEIQVDYSYVRDLNCPGVR